MGPDGGGVTALAIAPQDPDVVYAATRTAGVFRSSDGGSSWQPARSGLPAGQALRLLAAGGRDGRFLYTIAGTSSYSYSPPDRLFVSNDGGSRWVERALPAEIGDGYRPAIVAMAASPAHPRTVYLAINAGRPAAGLLLETADAGRTWQRIDPLPTADPQPLLLDLAVAPSAPAIMYLLVAYTGEILRSTDAGIHWSTAGRADGAVKLAIDPQDPRVLYAASPGKLARSSDGGITWSRPTAVLPAKGYIADQVAALAIDPDAPATIYYALTRLVDSYGWYDYDLPRYEGSIFRSTDSGGSWARLTTTDVVAALEVGGPQGRRIYAGVSRDGFLRSDDGGLSWRKSAHGLKAAPVCSLAADPFTRNLLYISAGFCDAYAGPLDGSDDLGFLRGGPAQTWTALNRGLRDPSRVLNAVRIVPDALSPGTLYALTGQGLWKSDDGGGHWRALRGLGSDQDGVTALAIDPVDSRMLYAVAFYLGYPLCGGHCPLEPVLFAASSKNGGRNWQGFLPPQPPSTAGWTYPQDVVVDPRDRNTLYVTGRFAHSSLLKSVDRGATWQELPILMASVSISRFLIHPADSRTLFAATLFSPEVGTKLVKSTDGGQTWEAADRGLPAYSQVQDLALDPARLSTLYAATNQGLFLSDDGGAHWSPLSDGLSSQDVRQVLVDPFDPATLYAATGADGGLFVLTRSTPP